MVSITKNAANALLFIGFIAFTASAADINLLDGSIQRAVGKMVLTQKTPLQKYREGLLALTAAENQKTPAAAELFPILKELAEYNTQFSGTANWDFQSHKLAKAINEPVKVYWNTHRGNSFIEIMDTYFTDNHGDRDLAKLEFLVKKHLFSYKEWLECKALFDLLPEDFIFEQLRLEKILATMSSRDGNAIVKNLTGVAKEYNKLYQDEQTRPLALQLQDVYFRQPIRTGWQKTVTMDELYRRYGMKTYVKAFSAAELQSRYGVSLQEAETLHAFFVHYHQ